MQVELREVAQINYDGRLMVGGAFHPSGREVLLLTGFAGPPLRWSRETMGWLDFECRSLPEDLVLSTVLWSPDGTLLALGGTTKGDDRVLLLDAATYEVVDELCHEPRSFIISFVGWNPARPQLVTAHEDTINFWSVDERPARKRRLRPGFIEFETYAAFTPDGRYLAIRNDKQLFRLDVATWETVTIASSSAGIRSMHAGGRDAEVFAAYHDGRVECWDASGPRLLGTLALEGGLEPAAFDPTYAFAATTRPAEKQRLTLFDATNGKALAQVPLRTRSEHAREAWSRDGRFLLTSGVDTRLFEVIRN